MKKLLFLLVGISLVLTMSIAKAENIPEGATIKTVNNPDVYIVKYKNGKQFKRLVLNPQVFESYGHLRWEDILTVDQNTMNSFANSDLVIVDGQTDIYQLVSNGNVGTKVLLESTVGYDLDSAYTINGVDFGNYVIGEVNKGTTILISIDPIIKIEKCKQIVKSIEEDFKKYNKKKKYKVYQSIRKNLQNIKVEAQEVRKKILDDFKKNK